MRTPASPAAPCGFCGLLSCVQQMIYVDAGPPGDALWLVAYGNLQTPPATVALSLTRLQGTDPAGASQLRSSGSSCLDISDVEIKEPVFIHGTETLSGRVAGTKHRPLRLSQHNPYIAMWRKHADTHRSKTVISALSLSIGKITRLLGWIEFRGH